MTQPLPAPPPPHDHQIPPPRTAEAAKPMTLVPSALDIVCQHTRPIVASLKTCTPGRSSSPLAVVLYHLPATRQSGQWLHPNMLNAPLEPEAFHARPVHVSALVASWTWFSWLVSRPDLEIDATQSTVPSDLRSRPISAHAAAHCQFQGPTDLVRIHPLTDVTVTDAHGWNVMHYAVLGDKIEWTQWQSRGGAFRAFVPRYSVLLWKADEPRARTLGSARETLAGLSPLDIAMAVSSTPSVLFLLTHNLVPDPRSTDLAGRSPLHHVRSLSLLLLLITFHADLVRQWMQTVDSTGAPGWVCALHMPKALDVAHAMTALMSFVYDTGGEWLPHSEMPHVQEVAKTIVNERCALGELTDDIAKLVLGWTSQQAVGFALNPALAEALFPPQQDQSSGIDLVTSQAPSDVHADASKRPAGRGSPSSSPPPHRPLSSLSLCPSGSNPSDLGGGAKSNEVDSYIQVHLSHASCPFPGCPDASTPLYCDQLVDHMTTTHCTPLSPTPNAKGRFLCSFPGCSKTVRRPHALKRHVAVHAPPMYKCTFDPQKCQYTTPSRAFARFHLRLAHVVRKTQVTPSDKISWQDEDGASELSDVDMTDAEEVAIAPTSSPPFHQRQTARKSTGGRRVAGLHRPTVCSDIVVEIPLFVSTVARHKQVGPGKLAVVANTSTMQTQVGPKVQSCASGRFTTPLNESIPATGPPGSSRLESSPLSGPSPCPSPRASPRVSAKEETMDVGMHVDDDSDDDIIDITPLHLGPRAAPVNAESDDDIVDVTPMQLVRHDPAVGQQPPETPAPPSAHIQPPTPLVWPAYLSQPSSAMSSFTSAPTSRAVVVIDDSDEEDNEDGTDMSSTLSSSFLSHYPVSPTHPLLAVSLPVAPPDSLSHARAYATSTDSTRFWSTVLKLVRDTPTLHPELARQYLPQGYGGPVPHLYMHRVAGRPFLSLTAPESSGAFTGHMLVPVAAAAVDKWLETSVSYTVGQCPVPAGMQAAVRKATNTYWVDRIKRPLDPYRANADALYFAVDPVSVTMTRDALVGGESDMSFAGVPMAVQPPPIVRVPVRSLEVNEPAREALVVVVRRKVFEWYLVGLGFPMPGEEVHAGATVHQKIVWY